ncbi:type II secretion system protein GspJ [Salipiger aestuarii]|uniref:type II secretion system protein GspJ n=1 Tax=Salipiger aestuarii TaxID=568098 RepID=UPI00025B6A53|nr:type II secretion system protein GspJ [Salipiger aestuarii]EIE50733.1 hypothetical protein C357_12394 [Citreicella sp. 357]
MTRDSKQRGLTLLELVIAMALFAMVAVMGVQSLTGMMRLHDGLSERDNQNAALSQAVSLLRRDLGAVLPRLFYPPDAAAPQSPLRFDGGQFAITTGGQPLLVSPPGSVPGTALQTDWPQRVEWRFDRRTATLWRGAWRDLTPASTHARGADVPVLQGVTAVRLRSYWPQVGWTDGTAPPGSAQSAATLDADSAFIAPETYSGTLPLAVEIVLVLNGRGPLRLIEALQ